MSRGSGLWVLLGLGGVGAAVVAVASRPGTRQLVRDAAEGAGQRAQEAARTVVTMIDDWMHTLIRKTSAHEGTYSSVQRNLDGNGVSYGILQWTQLGGSLYDVLSAMRAADTLAFDEAFGGSERAIALLAHVKARNMGPLEGAYLWNDPWLSRFRAAGQVPVLQRAQYDEAMRSGYMTGAVDIARILGVSTERAMVVYYNRTVHQGVGGATKAARTLADYWTRNPGTRPATAAGVLAQYAWVCASGFRRTTQPESEYRSKTTRWVRKESEHDLAADGRLITHTGPVWHAVTGSGKTEWDLWEMIMKRTADILSDPELRDQDVRLPAAPVA